MLPFSPFPHISFFLFFCVFVFIYCAFGTNPRFSGDKAGWVCRCYTLLLEGFRFRYQDKETYRCHPRFNPGPVRFSLGPVREDDTGSSHTAVEQNHYGGIVPMKKCLATTRKPNTPWLKPAGCLSSTEQEVWRQVPRVGLVVRWGLQGPWAFHLPPSHVQ